MTRTIRLARTEDLPAINSIYNHYVLESTCTYQETPEPMAARLAWFDRHGPGHPITVAELDGQVVGWGSLSPYHSRSAYRHTVENSVYVDWRRLRHGLGGAILGDLIVRAGALGHRTIVALIDESQQASVALHERHGFERVGTLKDVGYKFNRWLNVVYMQRLLVPSLQGRKGGPPEGGS
jgi:L-amino acid N-acyltransferase YncA